MAELLIEKKIEHWKDKLLDLKKTNRMINFRETKRTTLKLIEPSFLDIFQRIVLDEEKLTFQRPVDKDSDIRTYSVLALLESLSCPIPVYIGDIKTEASIFERQKTLKNMRDKSHLAIDEQGINILYMAVGFIEWKDGNASDSKLIRSPLILVPISLTIDSIDAPFTLQRYDDDIIVNPTLAYLFEKEYGISLPLFELEDSSIEKFMNCMESIADKKGWKVIREISIALLSFLKINMYKDLENNQDRILNNPIIKAISGDNKAITTDTDGLEKFKHDNILSKDCYQVLSADSSQQDAIIMSKKGMSFVMQGPPGTGKSQTIANIIAEALADDKTVLFVSEKMAALQVVYKRLQETHLSDFCLALHSHKANKREVLNEIGANLSIERRRVKQDAFFSLDELDIERAKLNQYADELHSTIEPLGMSFYQVYGALSKLKLNSNIAFELPDLEQITREKFSHIKSSVLNYANALYKMGNNFYDNPWEGFSAPTINYELKQNIEINFKNLAYMLKDIAMLTEALENEYYLNIASSWNVLPEIIDVLNNASKMITAPVSWLQSYDLNMLLDECYQNEKNLSEYRISKYNLQQIYCDNIFDIDAENIKLSIFNDIELLKQKVYTDSSENHELLIKIPNIKDDAHNFKIALQSIFSKASYIRSNTGYEEIISFDKVKVYNDLMKNIMMHPAVSEKWFSKKEYEEVRKAYSQASLVTKEITDDSSFVFESFKKDVLRLDGETLFEKFKDDYLPIWTYWNKHANESELLNIDFVKNFMSEEVCILKSILSKLKAANIIGSELQSKYNMPKINALDDISDYIEILSIALKSIMPAKNWCIDEKRSLVHEIIKKCEDNHKQIEELSNKISESCEDKIFDIDYEGILNRYKTEYTNIFKYLKKSYRKDRKNIRSKYKNVLSKLNDNTIINLLQDLKKLSENKKWLIDNEKAISENIGVNYKGSKTDWEEIREKIILFDKAASKFNKKENAMKILSLNEKSEIEKLEEYLKLLMELEALINKVAISDILYEEDSQGIDNIEIVIGKLSKFVLLSDDLSADFSKIIAYCNSDSIASQMTYLDLQKALEKIEMLQKNEKWLLDYDNKLRAYFKDSYKGLFTDWDKINADMECFERIMCNFDEVAIPPKLQSLLMQYNNMNTFSELDSLPDNNKIEELFTKVSSFLKLVDLSNVALSDIILHLQDIENISKKLSEKYNQIINVKIKERSPQDIFDDINILISIQKIENDYNLRDTYYKDAYPNWFNSLQTDWNDIQKKIRAALNFKNIIERYGLNDSFINIVCEKEEASIELKAFLDNMVKSYEAGNVSLNWIESLFEKRVNFAQIPLKELQNRIENCLEKLTLLDLWIDYRDSRLDCLKEGLVSFVQNIEKQKPIIPDISEAFCKGFYKKWIDKMSLKHTSILQFRERIQNDRVEKFSNLDEAQLPIAQMRIRGKIIDKLPRGNNFLHPSDERSTLLHEMGKKRRVMPLRKLFKSIPSLLLKLKPCFMMSPLSVSYFLEAQTYNFDMVIFDEASQIFPQDAIGAILRGKQVIIAGDSKQLPPTNFFSSSTENYDGLYDSDSEEDYDEIIYDSILEEASNKLYNHSLLWHYRSKYEDLIAFSNKEIYGNKLITFPSSISRAKDTGVEYIYVKNGIYEGGGKNCNINEARKCVDLVLEHIQKYPQRSLGIIAFSEKQQAAIEDAILEFRIKSPQYEAFFDENKEEAFFVKNLENVQGDERDTIFFSICYAKDKNGKMYMRFGPLGHQGGERRLNVAVTRAKCNIKLVGSILPEDIDLTRTNSIGVRMLRSYIEFAIKGSSNLNDKKRTNDLDQNEDVFCDEISQFLINNGYKLEKNLGCSDYKIDIAVKHPKLDACFVAGVECDGYSYVMARTARERDHLRRKILKSMGWNMIRIWSTDWTKDPETAGKMLMDFIEKSIADYKFSADKPYEEIEKDEVQTLVEPVLERAEENSKLDKAQYGFEYYTEAKWWEAKCSNTGENSVKIAESILHVVEIEQPIHKDLLYRRLAGLFGNEKATAPVRNTIDITIQKRLKNSIKFMDDFISLKDFKEIRVRIPKDEESERDIEHIAVLELAMAMKIIAANAFGISVEALLSETAKVFGFQRMGPKIRESMEQTAEYLLRNGEIGIIDEKVQVLRGCIL